MAGEWRELRLGDLVSQRALSISDGYRVRNVELGAEGIPFVRGGDIGDGWINTTTIDHIRPEFVDRVRAKLARPGDVAFITKGTVGRAGRLRPGQPAVVFAPQVAYWRVLASDVLDAGFLFYLIQSHAFQSALNGVKTHGSMVADYVSISLQHDFVFRFPDIRSQRAIAHILGTLDDKIELNRRMKETLEAMARALFKSWLVDFDPVRAKAEGRDPGLPKPLADLFPDSFEDSELGEIPKGWRARRVSDVIDFVRGVEPGRSGCNEEERGMRFIRVGEVTGKRSSNLFTEAGSESRCHPGDILLALDGTPGAVAYYLDGVFSSGIRKLVSRKADLSQCYIWLLATSDGFQKTIREHARGTTIQHAGGSVEYFRDIDPGAGVGVAFSTVTGSIWERLLGLHRENDCLSVVRNALLPKLISGELRVKDANAFLGGPGQ